MTTEHTDEPTTWARDLFAWGKAQRAQHHDAVPVPTPERPDVTPPNDETTRVIGDPVAYGRRAIDSAVDNVRHASEGFRNHTLNAAAYSLGRLVAASLVDEAVVVDALTLVAEEVGLDAVEIPRTIASGLRGGAARPVAWVRQPMPETAPTRQRAPQAHDEASGAHARRVRLTPASSIAMRPVRWLWDGRLPLGALSLLGGREGIGKSTIAYTIAADVTRGRLLGHHHGTPRSVIVAATEDSWEHTIAPRLVAAHADMSRVYRVDVETSDGIETALSLPRDITGLREQCHEVDCALILLDPLMSRLDASLDTHKDAEVRLALEPLTRIADETGATVLGLIHVNKSVSGDPLTMLMGSRAFAAVARSVLFVVVDPDDESSRLLGLPKNNLGRTDLPTLSFRIESATVATTPEGPVTTGRVLWLGESTKSIQSVIDSGSDSDARTATREAGEWLVDYLTSNGGEAPSADIKTVGRAAGHSVDALNRARRSLFIQSVSFGFPRMSAWRLPVVASPGETHTTATTNTTGHIGDPVREDQ